MVEQRTENPCVPGSIPGGTTKKKRGIAPQQRAMPLFSFLLFVAELVSFSFGLRTELNLLLDRSGRVKGVATLIIRIFAWSIRVICPIIVSV